ncbi:hypothetical protein BDW69DRAFT_155361 [Aspergillus filifer]
MIRLFYVECQSSMAVSHVSLMLQTLLVTMMGGMHIHLRVQFSNGAKRLARILKCNYTSFPDDCSNAIINSGCATLRWLENLDVPSPGLHDYGLQNDPSNDVSTAYMLIDELPGIPFLYKEPSDEQFEKVCNQWARILCAFQAHPFEQIGYLSIESNGDIAVGPIVGDRTGTFLRMGPFCNARDFYSTFAEKYMEMIWEGQLFSAYAVNAYLVFKYL